MHTLDAFKGKLTMKVKSLMENEMNTRKILVTSGGMTNQLQFLDAVVNKQFKRYLRKEYNCLLAGRW